MKLIKETAYILELNIQELDAVMASLAVAAYEHEKGNHASTELDIAGALYGKILVTLNDINK